MLVVVVSWLVGIAIPLDFNVAFFFSIYIVLMETVSVIENLDLAGIPMPVWIIKRLKKTMQDMNGLVALGRIVQMPVIVFTANI